MKITTLAHKIAFKEGKKRSISIAQIMEVLKCANEVLEGKLYKLVRSQVK